MEKNVEQFENTLETSPSDDQPLSFYSNWESVWENNLDSDDTRRQINDDHISFQAGYNETIYVPANPQAAYFRNLLMFPDWMVQLPDDFNTNWYMTLCPKGLRTLVVACNGHTKCFSKNGTFLFTTETQLPGGNYFDRNGSTTLDCMYNRSLNKLFVIDVIAWNNHIMADGTMEFRDYWLKSRFSEAPEIGEFNTINKLIFSLLPKIPCQRTTISEILMTHPIYPDVELDGFLFLHKESRYVAGQPSLVGWLYPYMIPKVLYPGMPIHEKYAAMKPKNLVDLDSNQYSLWDEYRDSQWGLVAGAEGQDAVAGPSSAWQAASDTASVTTDVSLPDGLGQDAVAGKSNVWQAASDTACVTTDRYVPNRFKFFDDELETDEEDDQQEQLDVEMLATTEHENEKNEILEKSVKMFIDYFEDYKE